MDVSSVGAASTAVTTKPVEAPTPPPRNDERNDIRVAPEPPRAALPPGQGKRIDLLV